MKIVSEYNKTARNAGPKAKVDVELILKNEYNANIYTINGKNRNNKIMKEIENFIKNIKSVKILNKYEDLTIIQIPLSKYSYLFKKRGKVVAFIHDLIGLRTMNPKREIEDLKILTKADYVIVHNDIMMQYLVNKGICKDKIIVLEMFDYLCEYKNKSQCDFNSENPIIIYTGNLNKAPFLKQLDQTKMNFNLNLYGMLEKNIYENKIIYKGSLLPDEVPNEIEGDLGLVWDGAIDESDSNAPLKNYTKFNNPHKLSCYLAAGKPVIVWSKSAIADFVIKNNIGYVINEIYDINKFDFYDYDEKKKNVQSIAESVRKGEYTKGAINKVLERGIKK